MDQSRNGMNSRRGMSRLVAATRYSMAGLTAAWRSEAAFRQEAQLAIVMVPVALWLGTTLVERLMLIATVVLVLIVELLNTAVEYTVDRIGTGHHHLSGGAKDVSSAAVLLSLALVVTTWGAIAWTRFATG